MPEKLVITSEAQAWEVLEQAMSVGIPNDLVLEFNGWPSFQMGVNGKDWHSTVPTRVMTPLLDVQKDINRAYANVRYGESNIRRLKDEERDELEVVVKVREGSSLYDAELWKQFSTIAEAAVGRMDGTQTVITVLGLALLVSAPVMYKSWLASRQKEKELEHQLQMSQEETKRLEMFGAAMNRQPMLAAAQEDVQATHNRFLKVTKPGDVLAVRGQSVRAEEASVLMQPERERAQDIVIEGIFVVLGNRTDKSEGFRITVKRLSDQLTVNADVPVELPYQQQQIIQEAEWKKTKVFLSINASILRDSISQANVVTASTVPSSE
jgi:hypothetical protein